MKLSTKSRYAIMAMMEVALRQKSRPVTLADISEEQSISISYLEQLFARLRKNGLVKGTRGPGGGYCLARGADTISIAEIVTSVEDKLRVKQPSNPNTENSSGNTSLSTINKMWDDLSQQIFEFLQTLNLAQFVETANQEEIIETQPEEESSNLQIMENSDQRVA
jgi:Rrf2 family iron-sulfur cluster assembly transcriptional regulator